MSSTTRTPLAPHPQSAVKSRTMSITQTYFLAHTARGKLSSEAARADHNLRLLVGHANLLDSLMLDLAEAEQEQESWFNQSVQTASTPAQPKHIQWADAIVEEPEEDWQAEDADSSDSEDEDDEDIVMADALSLTRVQSNAVAVNVSEEDEEDFEEDEEEDYASLSLQRSPSHIAYPPELSHDSESDSSEDESMPPSPPSASLPSFSKKQRQQIATTSFYDSPSKSQRLSPTDQASFFDDGYYLPSVRATAPGGIITAVSVY